MDEISLVSSFNPLDALESISKIYSAKQLTKTEVLKIQAQSQNFNKWLLEQKNENREVRENIIKDLEAYRKYIERFIDMILQNPETTFLYKDILESLLKINNELSLRMSEIRITSR